MYQCSWNRRRRLALAVASSFTAYIGHTHVAAASCITGCHCKKRFQWQPTNTSKGPLDMHSALRAAVKYNAVRVYVMAACDTARAADRQVGKALRAIDACRCRSSIAQWLLELPCKACRGALHCQIGRLFSHASTSVANQRGKQAAWSVR